MSKRILLYAGDPHAYDPTNEYDFILAVTPIDFTCLLPAEVLPDEPIYLISGAMPGTLTLESALQLIKGQPHTTAAAFSSTSTEL